GTIKDMGTGTEAVIIKDFIQYNGLFLSSSIPVQKQLVILKSYIIIKGLGYIHDIASHKSRVVALTSKPQPQPAVI
ncbi:MAG: hypothetical protein IJH78_01950, partial [Clostridia bacterium]|nr:hypothetical protein [Clostridia bacterium]